MPPSTRDPHALLPLPAAEFQILLALLDGPRHGHAVKVDLLLRTGGEVVMGPGTLYTALKRMVSSGLIVEVAVPEMRDHDARRRYYGMTDFGRAVAQAEARRLVRILTIARRKTLLPPRELEIQ